jgi:nucleoside-diphosphate-sugar epimerase
MGIVIIGAAGYIGRRLAAAAPDALRVYHAGGTSAPPGAPALSLEEPASFDYGRVASGDVVLLTSGIAAPDRCAADPARARAVNVTGTTEFIARVLDRGGRVVFFSTDTVYGEQPEPFDETRPCRPLGVYAELKHEVERRFQGADGFKTIRLSFVFSRDDSFTTYLARCASTDVEASLYVPFRRAVVHRDDVVAGAIALARNFTAVPGGIVNFGGPAVVDRPEFASILAQGAFPRLRWTAAAPPAEFFTNRARAICMTSPLLPILLGRQPATLAQAVAAEFPDSLPSASSPPREIP